MTTPNADHKAINRLLLHLRDWEFGHEGTWDSFHIVPTKDLDTFKTSLTSSNVTPTIPPYPVDASNEWQNSTLEEIESFVLRLNKSEGLEQSLVNNSVYILLDEKGLADKTCIVGERKFDNETDEQMDAFDKARVPWEEVHTMWANLDIANMNFDDYCDDDEGCDENFWWRWDASENGAALGLDDDKKAMRDGVIRRLEEDGHA